jgi:hypothetical protein
MRRLGVARLADPDVEAALELARAALARMGVSGPEQAAITTGLRRRAYGGLADAGDPLGRGSEVTATPGVAAVPGGAATPGPSAATPGPSAAAPDPEVPPA